MLSFLTLTGADQHTNITDMIALSAQYPFIEWGILYHATKAGTGRYPSLGWISALCDACWHLAKQDARIPHLALHLCGEEANRRFVQGEMLYLRGKESANQHFVQGNGAFALNFFERVQMNINLSHGLFTASDVQAACDQYAPIDIITQHNKSNDTLWKNVRHACHAVLFDSSGGRGISISTGETPLPAPLPGKWCGYAGGLTPSSLRSIMKRLPNLWHRREVQIEIRQAYWLDMESSLRTDDIFNLSLCEESAKHVSAELLSMIY